MFVSLDFYPRSREKKSSFGDKDVFHLWHADLFCKHDFNQYQQHFCHSDYTLLLRSHTRKGGKIQRNFIDCLTLSRHQERELRLGFSVCFLAIKLWKHLQQLHCKTELVTFKSNNIFCIRRHIKKPERRFPKAH